MAFKDSKGKLLLTIACIVAAMGCVATAASGDPGTSDDPLVTKSYVDKKIEDLSLYIDEKLSNGSQSAGSSTGSAAQTAIEVVEVESGQSIILQAGSQIILRGGSGSIIDSKQGGIADLTQGIDLRKGYEAPANHLLMVPRSDGRGVFAKTDCIFMVMGKYEVK
ncbi:MAG: hypothetical protein GT589_07210 [Peptoclostridium sp.]|uniref:hypothetical protein n=1 Tax=Peptoclostridium sp. TaxID=1904860 RepID=UPI00139D54CD|nr:hypothetical protein [Peptoclostridium sp.]MZQ75936.1 hypothetical protein [Peptoclostridium sp.]